MRRSGERGVIVVPPGIDVSLFRPGTAPKEPLVVTVATVSEKTVRLKGLDVFARVSAQVPEASFVVLGPSEDDAVVERLLGLGGTNLAIPGHRLSATELRDWYRRAAVYAQLSIRESFGVALAEAMACECRPVFTRRGALEEVAGPIGHAVGYGDVVSAAAAIRQAVRAAACPEARQRIATLYSRERRQHSLLRITSDLQRQA